MLKAIFFSERNLEELIYNILFDDESDVETAKIFISFYKSIYTNLTNMFFDAFTSIPEFFFVDRLNEDEVIVDDIIHVIHEFSKIVPRFNMNNIFNISHYSLIYKERDFMKIISFYYAKFYSFLESKCTLDDLYEKTKNFCKIASFATIYVENQIFNMIDINKLSAIDRNYVYIDNLNDFLAFYFYKNKVPFLWKRR